MTWRIRIIELLKLLTLIASFSGWLRDVIFPDGITDAELLILLVVLVVYEELLRIRRHFKIEE